MHACHTACYAPLMLLLPRCCWAATRVCGVLGAALPCLACLSLPRGVAAMVPILPLLSRCFLPAFCPGKGASQMHHHPA
jgi:hypothetical protein